MHLFYYTEKIYIVTLFHTAIDRNNIKQSGILIIIKKTQINLYEGTVYTETIGPLLINEKSEALNWGSTGWVVQYYYWERLLHDVPFLYIIQAYKTKFFQCHIFIMYFIKDMVTQCFGPRGAHTTPVTPLDLHLMNL